MFAVLHLSHFPLQAILRADPTLRDQPVALLAEKSASGTPRSAFRAQLSAARGTSVALASPAALAAGIEPGFSVPRAQARCPQLVVRARRPDLEQEAEAALLAAAFGVSPQVELTLPGVVTLDLSSLAVARRRPGLRLALAELQSLGLAASAGLGPTPLLALYAARQGAAGGIVAADRAFLAPLPLSVAEPTPDQSAILAAWGLRTLGDLTRLSKAEVTHRLGRDGLALWERAAGETTRPLRLASPTREFAATLDCEHELETLEPLLFIFRRFVDRLALDLRNAHLAALALELTLVLADENAHTASIRLPEAVTDPELLFRALQTHLETVRTTAGIAGVRLKVQPGRVTVRQQGLFDGGLRDPHGFADTLARVTALVGPDRAGRPARADTHRPDAFKLESPPPVLPPSPAGFRHPPRGLPLRRHRPAWPAKIELAGRTPAFVWTDHAQGAVRACAGPWHASGEWWEANRHWRREEWDVELADGGLYRLVRTPADGWFVEGEYD